MTLRFGEWAREETERRDLSGYAQQRVEEELRADETMEALWDALYAADDQRSAERRAAWDDDVEEPEEITDALGSVIDSTEDALDAMADRVVRETVREEIGGHTVDLRHSTRHDCPSCGGTMEHYYLGTADHDGPSRPDAETVVGWVCGHCEAEAEQLLDSDGEEVGWVVVHEGDREVSA